MLKDKVKQLESIFKKELFSSDNNSEKRISLKRDIILKKKIYYKINTIGRVLLSNKNKYQKNITIK
jgi:hypothetical protein